MGWSPATTVRMAKRYGHFSTETLREAVVGLDSLIPQGKGAQKGAQREIVEASLPAN
jgi:hypothetical protein